MSVWDLVIILAVFIAIMCGYFKGLSRRLSEWVGMLLALLASVPLFSPLNSFIETTFGVKGENVLDGIIIDFLKERVPVTTGSELDSIIQWLSNLYLPTEMKEALFEAIDSTTGGVFGSVYAQVANMIATPVWHIVLMLFSTILLYTVLTVLGSLLTLALPHSTIATTIDKFLGAIVSAFMMVLVIGVVTAILVMIVPTDAGLFGRWLHSSAMGPTFFQAVGAVLKGGLFL